MVIPLELNLPDLPPPPTSHFARSCYLWGRYFSLPRRSPPPANTSFPSSRVCSFIFNVRHRIELMRVCQITDQVFDCWQGRLLGQMCEFLRIFSRLGKDVGTIVLDICWKYLCCHHFNLRLQCPKWRVIKTDKRGR